MGVKTKIYCIISEINFFRIHNYNYIYVGGAPKLSKLALSQHKYLTVVSIYY